MMMNTVSRGVRLLPAIFLVIMLQALFDQCRSAELTIRRSSDDQLPVYNQTAENLRSILVDYFRHPRHHHVGAEYKANARKFIAETFTSYGLEVETHIFTTDNENYNGTNVIGILKGDLAGTAHDQISLVGAHYDTQRTMTGIDDNGSGVAAMLEVARKLTEDKCHRKYTTIFVAFDIDVMEEEVDAFSACFTRITCGCSPFVTEWLYSYLDNSMGAVLKGAILLQAIMNYDNRPTSQEFTDKENFPEAFDAITNDGNRGNFLGVLGRSFDSDLANAIMTKWETLPESKYKIYDLELDIEGVPTSLDQVKYQKYLMGDHFNFWNEEYMKAVYLTDTRDSRIVPMRCVENICDDIGVITDENLIFLAKSVQMLTDYLHDATETDPNNCYKELDLKETINEKVSLIVKTGQSKSDGGMRLGGSVLVMMAAFFTAFLRH